MSICECVPVCELIICVSLFIHECVLCTHLCESMCECVYKVFISVHACMGCIVHVIVYV